MTKNKKNPKAYLFGPFLFAHNSRSNVSAVVAVYEQEMIDSTISGPRGVSPEMKVRKLGCSICHNDYEECNHIEGEKYDDEICECFMEDFELVNVANVSHPQDPRSKITDMLVFGIKNTKKIYTWYGFETDYDNMRFKHIQRATDLGLISETIAEKFSMFFCSNKTGVITLP